MDRLKRIASIVNSKALIIAALAVAATYLCRRFGVVADFPLTLIATAVIFPLVFSISGAYKRREAALDDYGSIKAHGRAIFFAARDWPEEIDAKLTEEIKRLLSSLLRACRQMFTAPVDVLEENEAAVYRNFSRLSLFIKGMRKKGLASGEVSRCNQYLSKMIIAFENIKHIYQYRTPRSLRAYSNLFIVVLPILYGPYFAKLSQEYSNGLEYLVPVLFSIILVSLDNIQAHLENPFDQIGEDDITINAERFVEQLEA